MIEFPAVIMSDLLQVEFASAKRLFNVSYQKLKSSLENPNKIETLRQRLQTTVEELKKYYPSHESETKDPLNYIEVVPLIGEAHLLILEADAEDKPWYHNIEKEDEGKAAEAVARSLNEN